MNLLLILAGAVLVVTGIARAIASAPAAPKDGALEIRNDGTGFWVYKYVANPGWQIEHFAVTLEDARAFKKAHEKKPRESERVVE